MIHLELDPMRQALHVLYAVHDGADDGAVLKAWRWRNTCKDMKLPLSTSSGSSTKGPSY
jgi:hypothetical protein